MGPRVVESYILESYIQTSPKFYPYKHISKKEIILLCSPLQVLKLGNIKKPHRSCSLVLRKVMSSIFLIDASSTQSSFITMSSAY